MKYFKGVKGDVRDHFTGYTTVKNELLTPKERNRKFRYLSDDVFKEYYVSQRKIYWMFGCRFEVNG